MPTINQMNRFVSTKTSLDISRSKFPRNWSHKTTFKSGDLVPIYLDEVLPGDTFSLNTSAVVRMLTPAVPVMDNAFLDTYFFFVPARLCTFGEKDWQKIMGENVNGYWAPTTETSIQSSENIIGWKYLNIKAGSVYNYLGLPIGNHSTDPEQTIMTLPLVAYIKIWNEFFRDQNTQSPIDPHGAIFNHYGFNPESECLKVNKIHDYFTSCLPAPQKGQSVALPLGNMAPVVTADVAHDMSGIGLLLTDSDGNTLTNTTGGFIGLARESSLMKFAPNDSTFSQGQNSVVPANLYADLASATAATVNQLRQAFAIQRMLEKDARGGSRYREILKAHFNITIPDATIQIPEYLGGKRIPLNITQVLQTSETTDQAPLGSTGAFSNSVFSDKSFIKSFNEFGYIVGVACVRTQQSYSQGIPKLWSRNRRFDFYDPVFANLGEMAVLAREIDSRANVDRVFGYQEAWAEYRYHPSLVTGKLAPNAQDATLTAWTYTNKFSSVPTLNSDFMKQPASQIGDTLVVTDTETQFVADFYFECATIRPMPIYSIPGLIDHH